MQLVEIFLKKNPTSLHHYFYSNRNITWYWSVGVGETGLEIRSLEGCDNWTDLSHSHFPVLLYWGLAISTNHLIVGVFSETALLIWRENIPLTRLGWIVHKCQEEKCMCWGVHGEEERQLTRYWQWRTKERKLQRWRVNFCWRLFLIGISSNRLLLIVSSSNRSSIVVSSIASRKKKKIENFFPCPNTKFLRSESMMMLSKALDFSSSYNSHVCSGILWQML